MHEKTDKPHIIYSLLELRAPFEALTLSGCMPLLRKVPKGDGQPVLIIPGFMTGDNATFVMRRYLNEQGFATYAWGQGRNPGLRFDIYEKLEQQIEEIYEAEGQKVSIVGWSLGGLYARILGHKLPSKVRQVITLGSPFALNNTFATDEVGVSGPVIKLYERLNPNLKTDPLVNGEPIWETPPPVPSTAIYSEDDGIASWRYCVDNVAERAENIRIFGSHMGLTHNPFAFYAIADRLSQPMQKWQPFEAKGYMRFFYGSAKQERATNN